ncbi:MAG: hypothetical protein KF830_05650 [Planctomycetes bacterium]|nr:hypothetical protein [Planctomycetota bacterium]
MALLLALLGACQSEANQANHGVAATQFQDMVVPAGLRLRDSANESYSRQEASWRLGHFVYEGTGSVEAAVNYVRQRMPQHNWSKVRDEVAEGEVSHLGFERGIYSADYTFQRRDGITRMTVDYRTDYSRR